MLIEGHISVYEIVILPLAILLDYLAGELPESFHPTVWMGKLASFLESNLRGEKNLDKVAGVVTTVLCVLAFAVPVYLLHVFLSSLHWIIYITAMTLLLKSTFSVRSMKSHVEPIMGSLRTGNLQGARRMVSRIVSRDTSNFGEDKIISATIESTSEGITDGIVSPFFFFLIFGVPGAIAFRVVNTLDSMYGYKDEKMKDFGRFPAGLDTVLNFVPARITAVMVAASSVLIGAEWQDSFRLARKDSGKTSSPNAGWPMAATAGALNVRLEKPSFYCLGGDFSFPSIEDISKAIKLMKWSSIIFGAITTLSLSIFLVW